MPFQISAVGYNGVRAAAILREDGTGIYAVIDGETPSEFATATDAALALASASIFKTVGIIGGSVADATAVVALLHKLQFQLDEIPVAKATK